MTQPDPANNHVITDLASLQSALHSLIPISAHMGITATSYDGQRLVLTAPLQANINHQMSAFGGSLFSVSALAGWSILQLKLGELGITANTVISGGDVGYTAPVFEDLVCEIALPDSYPEFVTKLQSSGRASLFLTSEIKLATTNESAMNFHGKYVVKAL